MARWRSTSGASPPRGERRIATYAPEPAYRWADVVAALFVGSEVLTSRDRISDVEADGTERVY